MAIMTERLPPEPVFDDYAEDYGTLIHDPIRDRFASGSRFFFERKIEVIRAFFCDVGPTREMSWLDIGCGQGDLLRCGQSSFKSATGCDPSAGMLKSCGDLNAHHQRTAETLPFADASFDFVTAVCVFHHVRPDRRLLLAAEAFRVLKPQGIFCIIEHNPLNPVTRLIVSRTPIDATARLLSATETKGLMSFPSSVVLATRYFLLFPERLHRLTSPIEDALSRLPLGGQYAVFARRSQVAPIVSTSTF